MSEKLKPCMYGIGLCPHAIGGCGCNTRAEPEAVTNAGDVVDALHTIHGALVCHLDGGIQYTKQDLINFRQICEDALLPLPLVSTAKADLAKARESLDGAYAERNQLVAALSKLFPAGQKKTAIDGWDEAWHNCIYIDIPTGQVSWHIHDREMAQFAHLPAYDGEWDGHDTPEKYRRLAALAATDMGN